MNDTTFQGKGKIAYVPVVVNTKPSKQTMFEELIYKLEALVCRSKDIDDAMLVCDAINAINALGKPRWIPVTERLPEEYVNVLCHLRSLDRQSEYYSIDHLMEDGQWWKAANSWKHEVTHWMPLPEPPKEE